MYNNNIYYILKYLIKCTYYTFLCAQKNYQNIRTSGRETKTYCVI